MPSSTRRMSMSIAGAHRARVSAMARNKRGARSGSRCSRTMCTRGFFCVRAAASRVGRARHSANSRSAPRRARASASGSTAPDERRARRSRRVVARVMRERASSRRSAARVLRARDREAERMRRIDQLAREVVGVDLAAFVVEILEDLLADDPLLDLDVRKDRLARARRRRASRALSIVSGGIVDREDGRIDLRRGVELSAEALEREVHVVRGARGSACRDRACARGNDESRSWRRSRSASPTRT